MLFPRIVPQVIPFGFGYAMKQFLWFVYFAQNRNTSPTLEKIACWFALFLCMFHPKLLLPKLGALNLYVTEMATSFVLA